MTTAEIERSAEVALWNHAYHEQQTRKGADSRYWWVKSKSSGLYLRTSISMDFYQQSFFYVQAGGLLVSLKKM